MNAKVDFFFEKAKNWKSEFEMLRTIILDCGLTEELKWGCPCYTYKNSNLVLIHGFKNYCALLFFKGALLSNEARLLIQQTEHVQAARQMRFTNLTDVEKQVSIIKSNIHEAIEVEKAGLKVELKKSTDIDFTIELQQKLNEIPALKTAFDALTPGRQKAYNLHFSQPKQAKTRNARIEKCVPLILDGKGLND